MSMAINVGISEDDEFLVMSAGATSSRLFTKLLVVCRDKYHGKFQHNVRAKTGTGFFKNPWVFDIHLAMPLCRDIVTISHEEGARFDIPEWVKGIDCSSTDKDGFHKFRASINPDFVNLQWKGEYQKKAVLRGITQNRLALFLEMGLGKTPIIQTIMNHLVGWGRVERYVVVSPPEGVVNIAREMVKFSSFGLSMDDIYIVDPDHRNPFDEPHRVTVMTYRALAMLHDDAYKAERGGRPSKVIRQNYIPWKRLGDKLCIILDESQNAKTPTSKTWHILDKAKEFFDYRYIMSGTPATRYAQDLWTQMRFLREDAVPQNFYSFLSLIADVGNKYSKWAVNYYREDKVKDFLNSVEYLVVRERTKGNVDLPPVILEPVHCQLPPKQGALYRSIANHVLTVIKQGEGGRVTMRKLEDKFPYLSAVLHDPCILEQGALADLPDSSKAAQLLNGWDISENGKYGIAYSLLEKYADEGRKVILWSGHPAIIDALCKRFEKYHPYKLHGGVVVNKGESVSERNAAVCSAFLADKKSSLLIANYTCLSTAVNLVEVTRHIFWDRSWRSDMYIQAIKRSNRIGSDEPLVVNDLLFCDSIEEYQYKEISKRLDFNNELWMGAKGAEDVLDKRDVLSLTDMKGILTGRA